ncbi:hypothetical protein WMZ97_14155 [Lentibacillus sp. N15]
MDYNHKNIGYAMCIDKLVDTSKDSELCFRQLYPKLEAELNMIWKKHQAFSKGALTFLEQLRSNL